MNEVAKLDETTHAPEELPGLELGKWMGRREAFGLMAGRCTAAEVESLRRLREEKSYKQVCGTWAQFCTQHLRVSRRNVDRAIGHLQEFGPAFFHITQTLQIGPKDYRAIADHVSEKGVRIDDNVVALLPENHQQIAAAVTGLLERIEKQKTAPAPPAVDAVIKRCRATAEMLENLNAPLDRQQTAALSSALLDIRVAAAGLGIHQTV